MPDIRGEVQDALGIPWAPDAWAALADQPEAAALVWARLRPSAGSGAFLREALGLLGHAFEDLSDGYGSGEGVAISEEARRGLLRDLDALLHGNAQLLLMHAQLRVALREGAVGRPGPAVGTRPRSAYRRRALEAVDEVGAPRGLQRLFADVAETLTLPETPVDVRVVGKWPEFAVPAWRRLKRWRAQPAFFEACGALERRAEAAARRLSPPVALGEVELLGALDGDDEALETLERWAELTAAEWPLILIMDAFFRVEAAVHPERRGRPVDADAHLQ